MRRFKMNRHKSAGVYLTVRFCAVLLAVSAVGPAATQARETSSETESRESRLAAGTRWEMPVWEIVGPHPGPTVVVIGGIHGDEPSGMMAARKIARWSIKRGRVIVVPRANHFALEAGTRRSPDAPAEISDLNRNFPSCSDGRQADAQPRCDLSRVLWEFLRRVDPDWVIDLHEGFDFHGRNERSVGSSVIYQPTPRTEQLVPKLLAEVNDSIDDANKQFVSLRPPVNGSLARAAAVHLGAEALILETTNIQPLPLRVEQHCTMVRCLLGELAMRK